VAQLSQPVEKRDNNLDGQILWRSTAATGGGRYFFNTLLVLCHTLIFGWQLPAPPGPGARVRARCASGGTSPRTSARGSDAVTNP